MAAPREYELVLMLDPGQDAPARDAVANEAKQQIEAAGTLKNENVWGLRKLAYEIKRCNEADYRWFRFEAPTELLEQLDHNLKIADGVLRFRIFKVDADTPVMAPPASSAPGPGASRERPAEAPAAPAAEPAAPAEPATPEPAAETSEPEAPAATAVAEPPAEEPAAEPEPAEADAAEAPAEGEPGDPAE
ncbi:MAG TPA: 30S ribosomal protein S6 [Solirubrobacterales bacterium]|nr:30S ribosomal protein S6 [Solirubrobacterales bacterium]